MLPRRDLLEGAPDAAALEPVIAAAEDALRTWQPVWTPFLPAELREQAEARLGALSDLRLHGEGGYAGAERQRLLLQRGDAWLEPESHPMELEGLELSGNFLFDPPNPATYGPACWRREPSLGSWVTSGCGVIAAPRRS